MGVLFLDRQMGSAALLEVTHCQECHYQCIKDSLNRQCETLCLSRCIYIHSHRDINTCHHLGLYVTHAHVNPSTKGQWHTHIHTHIHTHTHISTPPPKDSDTQTHTHTHTQTHTHTLTQTHTHTHSHTRKIHKTHK